MREFAHKHNSVSTKSDTANLTNGMLVNIQTTVSFIVSPSITALSLRKPALAGMGNLMTAMQAYYINYQSRQLVFFSFNQQTDDATVLYEYQFFCHGKGKGKAVPLQTWTGPEGSRKLRWQRNRMVEGCQPYAPADFTPRKCSWYSFLLEAESTPGP